MSHTSQPTTPTDRPLWVITWCVLKRSDNGLSNRRLAKTPDLQGMVHTARCDEFTADIKVLIKPGQNEQIFQTFCTDIFRRLHHVFKQISSNDQMPFPMSKWQFVRRFLEKGIRRPFIRSFLEQSLLHYSPHKCEAKAITPIITASNTRCLDYDNKLLFV